MSAIEMFDLFESFVTRALGSEIFAGGLALGVFGLCLGAFRALWLTARSVGERRWMASVTVDNRSAAFRHLFVWLDATGALRRVRQVRATGVHTQGREIFAPVTGKHWFIRDVRLCFFTRVLNDKARVGPGHSPKPMEVLTITVLFGRPERIREWIAEGAALCRDREKTGPGLHVLRGDWWAHVSDLRVRSLDTVLSEDDRIESVAADMRRFLGAEEWYRQRGVPWRRGYLFHGPPGTGKSSLIRALASDLGRDIATVPLSSRSLTDEDLRDGMTNAPKGAMLVLEDIDAGFAGRQAGEAAGGVTFSGLLNAIDGVAAQEGRVLVMTTNHPEKLDPALIRPGRADVHVELGLVGAGVAKRLFLRFFPGEEPLAERFAMALGDLRVSPAALQGWLLEHAFDAQKAATASGLRPQQTIMAAE